MSKNNSMAARILVRNNIRIHKPYAKQTLKYIINIFCLQCFPSHIDLWVLMVCGTLGTVAWRNLVEIPIFGHQAMPIPSDTQ